MPEAGHPFFYGEETDDRFVSILKAAPAKDSKDGKLDVSILVQEYFMVTSEDIRPSPRRYLDMFVESMNLFPTTKTCVVSRMIDADATPCVPKGLDFLKLAKGSRHLRMGQTLLEKRLDGKLYLNGKEVIRRPLTQETIEKENETENHRLINACVLWALWRNPVLVPTDWYNQRGITYFRGTIFADDRFAPHISLYIAGISVDTSGARYYNQFVPQFSCFGQDHHEAVLAE